MKRNDRVILLSVLLGFIILLSGCWDAKELDDLAIPLVVGYDTVLESEKKYPDDKYLVTVGIPVFYKEVKDKFHVIETTGQIIGEAVDRRNSQLGEQVIYGQLQILLVGDELGKKENLLEITDALTRNPRVKASVYIMSVKGRVAELFKKPLHSYPNLGIYLKALMRNSQDTNFYPYMTVFLLNRSLISYETAALLPHIAYREGEILLAGSCLVNKGKITGEMGREETETAVIVRGMEYKGTLSFNVEKDGKIIDKATFEGRNSRKVSVEIIDGKYVFNIRIKLSGAIVEHKEQKPMQNGEDLLMLFQESLEQHVKKRAEAFVEKTQEEFKFDALNLASHIKAYTREKLTKEDIDRIVQEADINVEVKVHLRNAGGKM